MESTRESPFRTDGKKYIYFNFQLELRIHFLVVFKPIVPILHHSKYKLERKAELSAYLGYSTC